MSAIEVTVAVALLSVLASAAFVELAAWRASQSVLGAGIELALQIEGARAAAVATRTAHALVFQPSSRGVLRLLAVDGDGDGVLRADLDAGVDTATAPGRPVADIFPGVTTGLASEVPPVPGGTRPQSALPMYPTGVLSAAPEGTLSTGTVYLCHRAGPCFAVRVYGPGGRVGGWFYRAGRWERRW